MFNAKYKYQINIIFQVTKAVKFFTIKDNLFINQILFKEFLGGVRKTNNKLSFHCMMAKQFLP